MHGWCYPSINDNFLLAFLHLSESSSLIYALSGIQASSFSTYLDLFSFMLILMTQSRTETRHTSIFTTLQLCSKHKTRKGGSCNALQLEAGWRLVVLRFNYVAHTKFEVGQSIHSWLITSLTTDTLRYAVTSVTLTFDPSILNICNV